MVVKVGSGSSGYTFERKGAEWADVKAGSLDTDGYTPGPYHLVQSRT